MRVFEVYVNDKRQCIAGIDGDGVLNAILDHVAGQGPDEVRVKIIESDRVDKPRKRHRRYPVEDRKNLKRYVRAMAKEFGWQITVKK